MNLPKSAGEPIIAVPPSSASRAFELRVGETRVNGLVELVDDLRRLRERSIADRCRGFWS
jgi:hypothetical protein